MFMHHWSTRGWLEAGVRKAAASDRPIAATARAHAPAIFVLLDFMESSPLLIKVFRAIEVKTPASPPTAPCGDPCS
jgi:hypothetical protein